MKNNKFHDRMVQYSIKNKDKALQVFTENILSKTAQIFEYRGLPESVPKSVLENYLQSNGNVLWYQHEDELYVFTGGLGGVPDVYYRPTEYNIANPALAIYKTVKLGVDGELMKNDNAMQGLLPLIYKYGTLLTEGDISFYNAIVNTRDYNAISASDDKTVESAREYQRQIEAGNTAIITENQLLEGIRRHPTSGGVAPLADLRETYQYIKSLLYSDLGMKVSHNMKREYVSEEENIVNDDTLLPLIDNMLECRQRALVKINKMFGTNIEVELKGTWELQAEELEVALEIAKNPEILQDEDGEMIETSEETEELEEIEEVEDSEELEDEENEEVEETEEVEIDINININTEEEIEEKTEDEEVEEDEEETE